MNKETEEKQQLLQAPSPAGVVVSRKSALIWLIPSTIIVLAFLIAPAIWTLILGLTNYRLTGVEAASPQFVGLENFTNALTDPDFLNSIRVTVLFVLGSAVFGQALLGFLIAWTIRDLAPKYRSAIELVVILAWIIPSSVVTFLWIAMLNGPEGTLNTILGIDTEWFLEYPLLSIIVFNIWRGTAFSMLLSSAALASVPPSFLQTARLAGASNWQILRDVVLPSIKGYLITNLLLITLWTFNDFTPFLLTGGGPGGKTETVPVFIYQEALRFLELGYGSAIAAIALAINFVIAMFYLRSSRKNAAS